MPKDPQMTFLRELSREVTPDAARPEPRIWFREIAVVRTLDNTRDGNEVQRIGMRRGLNILWAPPEDATKTVRMYEDGLSGHASGKTLFCRLLRYLLGDQNYGNDAMHTAVGTAFPELWVVGEVVVAGETWLAARPMAGGMHRFAVRGVGIDLFFKESPAHGDYAAFLAAVEEATCGQIEGREEANELFRWRFLLPWLTRDQECRFAALTDWRSPLSESKGPQTSYSDQQLLMRAVLGMLSGDEPRLKMELQRVEDALKTAEDELPGLERDWRREWRRLSGMLVRLDIKADEPATAGDMQRLEKRATLYCDGVREALRLAEADAGLESARKRLQERQGACSKLCGEISQATADLESTRRKWDLVTSQRQRLRERGIQNPKRIEDGMCPHTLEHALERGCVESPPGQSIETMLELGSIQSESDTLKDLVNEKQTAVSRLTSSKEQIEADVEAASLAHEREKRRVADSTADLRRKQGAAENALEAFVDATATLTAFRSAAGVMEANARERESLKGRLEKLRKTHAEAEKRLSNLFADVVRAVMGSQVMATARLLERGIDLKADRNGDLYGAALETIKVLSFDIAGMAASIEGAGLHPRFLIHDGPREADMARVIYERFFLYARKLEEAFPAGTGPSFQYIITTTTAPPEDMQYGSRWLLDPVLNGSRGEGRLLRVDL